MSISLSEAKQLCTGSELALVKASLKPQISKLSEAELKRLAERARKLLDKWRGQSRGQSRVRGRQVGFTEADTRSHRKTELFAEVLDNLQGKLGSGAASGRPTSGQSPAVRSVKAKPKTVRSAKHRATRAAVRATLSEKVDSLQAPARSAAGKSAVKKSAAKAAPAAKTAAAKAPAAKAPVAKAKQVVAKKAVAKKSAAKQLANSGGVVAKNASLKKAKSSVAAMAVVGADQRLSLNRSKQGKATTKAKASRVVRSGLTTRTRGHVSAQGRRVQGRRDGRSR